ncbi:hypothetical protein L3Q82_007373 [Scortum barcoo]|uniref:Uncharacterized protein n=1 Tax=Scortum barcoo TaxID=214431 RepID=A0ACB8WST1_9TELE|nr:hypothetical protein L3Q82_007373 [Scortum barcoo]
MPREHCPPDQLSLSTWLSGPAFLRDSRQSQTQGEPFDLVDPDTDPELRPEVVTCTTTLLEGRHHVTELIVRHFHEKVYHQGRHFTEGAVRAAGFWIVGGKRAVSSTIFNCVTCRRLRGKEEEQIMADLPKDRLCSDPPFTYSWKDAVDQWKSRRHFAQRPPASTTRQDALRCPSVRPRSLLPAPRDTQRDPEAPRGTQRHPETPRGTQRDPETPRGTQRHPETPRGTQRHPETPRGTQRHPEAPRDTQRHPETPALLGAGGESGTLKLTAQRGRSVCGRII